MTEVTDAALEAVFTIIMQSQQAELAEITDPAELERFWYFKYDADRSDAANLYEFNQMLDLYRRKCRSWEEQHNGISCVVERVRDKYLWPKLQQFIADVKG